MNHDVEFKSSSLHHESLPLILRLSPRKAPAHALAAEQQENTSRSPEEHATELGCAQLKRHVK